jgi:hypothetical protein
MRSGIRCESATHICAFTEFQRPPDASTRCWLESLIALAALAFSTYDPAALESLAEAGVRVAALATDCA